MFPWTPTSLPYLIEIFIARKCAALYYTAVELEKMWQTENREQMENREQTKNREQADREQRTEKAITEATLIPMDRQVERANKYFVIIHSQLNQAPPSQTTLLF